MSFLIVSLCQARYALCVCVCVIAESVNVDTCRYQDSYNVPVTSIANSAGYISSQALADVPATCNRADRPWVIAAQQGQRINLTLFNFTPLRPNQLNSFPSYNPDSHTQPGLLSGVIRGRHNGVRLFL